MSKKTLAWVSDNPKYKYVGQSRVAREFLKRLSSDYDIVAIGFNEPKATEHVVDEQLPYRIETLARTGEGADKRRLVELLAAVKPDITVLSHDPFLFPNIKDIKQYAGQLIGYYTIDGDPVPRVWGDTMYWCDKVAVPSRYGQRALKERFLSLNTYYIPYGVDKSFFLEPNTSKEDIKAQVEVHTLKSRVHMDLANKFVAIFWGHFQGRKNLIPAFMAWEKFTRRKPDTLFICVGHFVPINYQGWIYEGEYDILDFLEIPNVIAFGGVVDDAFLRLLIWAADVLIFCGYGEGFGLPNIEAMAGRCLPISTYFAAPTDYLTKDNSFPLYKWNPVAGAFGVQRAVVSPDEVRQNLEHAYAMWKAKDPKLSRMRDNAQQTAKQYDWDQVAGDFKKMLADKAPHKFELIRV